MKFCPMCGCQLPDEAVFCGSCGASLQEEVPTAPAYQYPPDPGYQQPYSGYQPGPGYQQPYTAGPAMPARRKVRANMLVAALLCIVGAVVAFVKPNIIPYSLPAAIALAVLAVMFLVLAWSPKEAHGLLGKPSGMSKGAFAGLLVALAIVVPAIGEAGGILPQDYKLIGSWRVAGEMELLVMDLERGSFSIRHDREEYISGTWSYKDDVLTLTPNLFSGEEPITGSVQLLGDMMTYNVLGDETILFYRYP